MDMDITFRSDMDVELVDSMGSDLSVAQAAWVSTQGAAVEDFAAGNTERVEGLIRFLVRNRHSSPLEHTSMTFLVRAPIFVWREHHRHRIASYNEESGRYKQLSPEFYVPADDRGMKQVGKPGAYQYVPDEAMASRVRMTLMQNSRDAYGNYQMMLNNGVAREVARMVLPVNIYSSCFVTMNARALMNFLSLRTKREGSAFPSFPQREIEMVAEAYEREFAALFPITYAAFNEAGRVSP